MSINTYLMRLLIKYCQRLINYTYKHKGLTENVFKCQVELNQLKLKYGVSLDDGINIDEMFL